MPIASADVFTADDVVAVSLLSVRLTGRAAYELLVRRRDEFSALLARVGLTVTSWTSRRNSPRIGQRPGSSKS